MSVIKQAPCCLTVGSWLGLGCMFGCARSSAISMKAWPRSLAGVYIRVCCRLLVELGCTPWFVFLGCAIAMPPSAIRKRPVSAMVESGPAAALAATRGMSHGTQALHLRRRCGHHAHTVNHSLKSTRGITLSGHSCAICTCQLSRPSR